VNRDFTVPAAVQSRRVRTHQVAGAEGRPSRLHDRGRSARLARAYGIASLLRPGHRRRLSLGDLCASRAGPGRRALASIDLSRNRSAAEIVRSTLSLYGDYPWLFLILAFVVMAPWDLAKLAVTGISPLGHAAHVGFLERESLVLLDLLLVSPLISAMHVHAVVAIGDAQRPRLGAVASKGVRVLPIVGVSALVAGVGVEIGLFALVIPGIALWIRLFVVPQAAAIERDGVRNALRSSWRLTREHGSHIFGLLAVFAACLRAAWGTRPCSPTSPATVLPGCRAGASPTQRGWRAHATWPQPSARAQTGR
jgi:hypothetical protein